MTGSVHIKASVKHTTEQDMYRANTINESGIDKSDEAFNQHWTVLFYSVLKVVLLYGEERKAVRLKSSLQMRPMSGTMAHRWTVLRARVLCPSAKRHARIQIVQQCKARRQQLLTWKVSSCRLLALLESKQLYLSLQCDRRSCLFSKNAA